ncbi:hypothetical protein Baya_12802 [Bagarius yarrelli]|uniref:Secretory calcium-binding phosphoprotein 9 n=1 Tax=Bagarius yarrelli TaxID=175774 RepID=A0A556V452_BAGYA|nr:hypothetical protein Baya_12802 [Bagarius yarrelli]
MKLLVFVAFLATAACKLLVVGGLNGGAVGLNPGVVSLNPGVVGLNGGLLNPGLVVGGVNPLLGGGGAFIAQPPVAPMFPAIPPYLLQPQFGLPGAPAQLPQQFPFQPNGVFITLLCGFTLSISLGFESVRAQCQPGSLMCNSAPLWYDLIHTNLQFNSH